MADVTRILIIRFSSIGDIVLTTPVIRYLKQQLDGPVEVHFLTKEQFAPVIAHNPHLNHIHTIKKDVSEVIEELKTWDFNYVVDLHSNFRSRQVKKALNSFPFTFHKVNISKWFYVNFGIDQLPEGHVVDRYLESVKAFHMQDDSLGLDYFIGDEDVVSIDSLPQIAQDGYVAMAIGAAHKGKRMLPSQMAEAIKLIDLPVLLIGDSGDQEVAQKILNACSPDKVVDMTGKCSINQSASIVQQSQAVIAGDTGMMHVAAAFSKKIVSVWGCTSPRFGMFPYRPHPDSVILEPQNLKKRPCSKLGNRCKYGMDSRCISHIAPQTIAEAVNQLISRQTAP